MGDLVRISMTIEKPLFEQLEKLTAEAGAENRSRFIQDLLRTHLAIRAWGQGGPMHGTITLLYRHHQRELAAALLEIQHDTPVRILAATHVHLDHDTCMEVLLAHGQTRELHRLAEQFRQLKGVEQVAISLVSAPGPDPAADLSAARSAPSSPARSGRRCPAPIRPGQ